MNKNPKLPQDLMDDIKRAVDKQQKEADSFAKSNFKPNSNIRRMELNQIAIAYAASDITNPVLTSTRIQTTRTARCSAAQAEKMIQSHGTPIAITRSGGNVYTHLREDGRGQLDIIWASGVEVTIKFFFGEVVNSVSSTDQTRLSEFLTKVESNGTDFTTKEPTKNTNIIEDTNRTPTKMKVTETWLSSLLNISITAKHLCSFAIFIFICWSTYFTGDYNLGIFKGIVAFFVIMLFMGFVQVFPFGTTLMPLLFEWWWHDTELFDFSPAAWILSGISMAANIGFLISYRVWKNGESL